jgi:ribosome recycling factor
MLDLGDDKHKINVDLYESKLYLQDISSISVKNKIIQFL